ncbi:MAG: HAMP domain-containing histidine kinase, partial [Chitinivibrionales bacterium]|nr:HAMP domain-containing histidine kinase [Chitinivibrionales bacterium]
KHTRDLRLDLAAQLPKVKGNDFQIEQIVINLIKNACESLPDADHGIVVTTRADSSSVVLTVRDQGCGMDKKTVQHIFEPFYTKKGTSGGMGLGLSICRNIIKQYGGDIVLDSEIGVGTVVRVTIPFK